MVLPYFAGERTLLYDPQARGVICGLTLDHTRGHLYRALLEATAYGVRHILEVMREAGGGGKRLVAIGGGTKGGLWTQIVSDVTGKTQELPYETIGASYGDAWLAARAAVLVSPDEVWNTATTLVEPNTSAHDVYATLYHVFKELYPATRSQVHTLAALQEGEGLRAVGRRRRCLFSRAVTDPCIAAPGNRRSVVAGRTTNDRAGNIHDRNCSEAR